MSTDLIRALARDCGDKALCGAALAMAVRTRSGDANVAMPRHLAKPIQSVLQCLGAESAIQNADLNALNGIAASLCVTLLQAAELVASANAEHSWSYANAALLSAAGEVSRGFPLTLARLLPGFDGLAERLTRPGATFLDVGVGVGYLSISMAGIWPELHIVGLDPWAPSIAMARENVQAAGLESRIELRQGYAEELGETDRYDLCWVPGAFINPDAIPGIISKAFRALRPGGWLLLAMMPGSEDPLESALAALRAAMMGGGLCQPDVIESLIEGEDFVSVRQLPSPPASPVTLFAGQKPAA
jgi:2-polyprenyl-3-methyl-5-hydroxy-6-metoxy-1,4-benzoquinol methylase